MNRNKVNQLINEMVQVVISEVDTMINNSNLIVKVKTDAMTASLIAKSIGKYGLDWSSDIIRDEVIATLYESMLTVAKGVEAEEIQFDNPAFMGKVYKLVELKLRDYLVPKSRKSKDGKVIGSEEAVSPIAEGNEAVSKLEAILNGQDTTKLMMVGQDEKINQFIKWFNNNKKDILTRKQLQFLDGELILEKWNECKFRKRIAERVSKAYTNKYGTASYRIATLMDQKETLETILEAKDFKAALLPHMEELFIIDTIIDNVSPKATRAFNTGSTETWVIKEYRIALFKALGNIIEILNREGF